MSDSNIQFIALEKIKFPLVNQFYKRVYKKGIAGKNEQVFVLKNAQQIMCSAKLKSVEQTLILTGVACDPNFQNLGYASSLIQQLLKTQKQEVYCFPYAHLKVFYLRLGFIVTPLEEAPASIQQRFTRYQQHRDLLFMVYKQ